MNKHPAAAAITVALIASFLRVHAYCEGPAAASADPWERLPAILAAIKAPVFPDRDFQVTDFGARGDGTTDATKAFRAAVTACAGAGGGRGSFRPESISPARST